MTDDEFDSVYEYISEELPAGDFLEEKAKSDLICEVIWLDIRAKKRQDTS